MAGLHKQVPLNGWWDSEPDRACHGEFILSHHPFKGFFVGVRKLKWFKHDSNAAIDAKIERLILNYGIEGYGLYFYCLELIARNVEKHNLTFELEHDAELIGSRINVHKDRVSEMMTFMCNIGLFENSQGIITCLKMATRTDEYTQKIIKSRGNVPTLSRQSPDNVRLNRIEEKRIEESKGKKNGVRFTPPTLQEIKAYCQDNNKTIDEEQFWNFYESKGWYVGKNKMKSWKHAVATWQKRNNPQIKKSFDPTEHYV